MHGGNPAGRDQKTWKFLHRKQFSETLFLHQQPENMHPHFADIFFYGLRIREELMNTGKTVQSAWRCAALSHCTVRDILGIGAPSQNT